MRTNSGAPSMASFVLPRMWATALVACFIPGAQAAQPPVGGGLWHSGALGADGRVRTWGDDGYGQLGIGRALYSLTPAAVSRANGVKAVSAGWALSRA